MKRLQTKGIVLSRTDFGEADRIITVLTPNYGKVRLMARGVRKPKSKLAGGIELFSVSDLTFIEGKGEIGTLISSRLSRHYSQIVNNIDRVQLGYELINMLNKATEDHPEPDYFDLLEQTLGALNDSKVEAELVKTWFEARLLKLAGHSPNLKTDTNGEPLDAAKSYGFDYDSMSFTPQPHGAIKPDHIKILRLMFNQPIETLAKVEGLLPLLPKLIPLIKRMSQLYLRIY